MNEEFLNKTGIKFDAETDTAKVNLDSLQQAMRESPAVTDQVEKVYKDGLKANFQKFYDIVLRNDVLFPSLGFDKREMMYKTLVEFLNDVFPDKVRRDS